MKENPMLRLLRKAAGWLVGVGIVTALLAGAGVLLAPAVAKGPVVQPLHIESVLPARPAEEGRWK